MGKNQQSIPHENHLFNFLSLFVSLSVTAVIVFFLYQFNEKGPGSQPPIKVEREFRAAWVATVANINWPSQPGLTVAQQQQEAITILDSLQANNFNAVILQVRPQSDALYHSKLEPWSYYLTGQQGQAPEPFYDPLEFWIEQAHLRGLELHAWLNPYRAHHIKGGEVTEYSVVNTRPDLVVKLAMGYHWLIPTKKETIEYSLNVVMDIVKRYQIDGIHFDDYFYPYPSYNNGEEFPDAQGYANYQNQGGKLSRDDWRRDHVNSFIKQVYRAIKSEKNHVKFGISPFGIWRPGHPESIEGFDQYEKLYADAKLWLNRGWVDYFVPQLYWPINQYPQSFPLLLSWWEKENTQARHLWPGIRTRLAEDEKAVDETINQIMISRAMLSDRPGNIFWNVAALANNPSFNEQLITGPYRKQALTPVASWLDSIAPDAPIPTIKKDADHLQISWENNHSEIISHWVVYSKYHDQWQYQILPASIISLVVPGFKQEMNTQEEGSDKESMLPLTAIAVTAIDQAGNESPWISNMIVGFSNLTATPSK